MEKDALPVDYAIRGMNQNSLRHILTATTLTAMSTVLVVKGYMAIGDAERLSCKATG